MFLIRFFGQESLWYIKCWKLVRCRENIGDLKEESILHQNAAKLIDLIFYGQIDPRAILQQV